VETSWRGDGKRAGEWYSGRAVQWDTRGLNIPPSLPSHALQKRRETRPVVYALRLSAGAGEHPPEHHFLGYWQYHVDHVANCPWGQESGTWLLADGTAHPRAVDPETSRLCSDGSKDPHVRLFLEDHLEFDLLVDLGPNCCPAYSFISHFSRRQAKSEGHGCTGR